ncbi:Vacuolar protein sorting-associated protein 35B [Orobanche minor]
MLVRRLEDQSESISGDEALAAPKKIFQMVTQTIEALSSIQVPELALGLYLECAEAANNCDLEPVAYEFLTQAYILYEEEITDSKSQVTYIHLIIGTLQRMHVFGVDNRDALTHKATGYSAKLLKKSDQCRAVYACSHLFWLDEHDSIRDGERCVTTIFVSGCWETFVRSYSLPLTSSGKTYNEDCISEWVLLCLKRALRIANAVQQMASATRGGSGSVILLIEILNKYLYFYEKGVSQITVGSIQSLVELIRSEMQGDNAPSDPAADALLASTLRYIQFQKDKCGALGEKYKLIVV